MRQSPLDLQTFVRISFALLFICFPLFGDPNSEVEVIPNRAILPILTPSLAQQKKVKIRLRNGLEAYLISDPLADQSGAALTVKVGSWYDQEGNPGIAHFTEHLLFLGTKKFPKESEYDRFITEHGGRSNAFTANELTSYLFSVDNKAFPEALERFSDFFKQPLFSSSGVDRELNAIDQEYAKNVGNDLIRQLYVEKELAHPLHPYHRFNMGNRQSLAKTSRETVMQWYRDHYKANLMRLIVYSPLPLDQLQKLVVQEFKAIPNGEKPLLSIEEKVAMSEYQGQFVYIEPIKHLRSLTLMWDLPAKFANMKESRPDKIVCHLLGHEGTDSLLAELKREKFAEKIRCGGMKLGQDAMQIHLTVDLTEKGLSEVNTVILRCFQAIEMLKREEGIPPYIFEEIHRLATIEYQYQPKEDEFQSLMKQVYWLADEEMDTFPEQTLILQMFDPTSVQELLNDLTPQYCRYEIMAPSSETGIQFSRKEQWLGAAYVIKPVPQELLRQWESPGENLQIHLPQPNPFIPQSLALLSTSKSERQIPVPKILRKNDFTTIYYSEDIRYGVPKCFLQFEIKTPEILLQDPTKIVAADLFIKQVEEKLNKWSYPANLAGLNYSVKRIDNGIVLSVEGYSEKAPLLFLKILDQLKQPSIDPEHFQLYRDSLRRSYDNELKESSLKSASELFKHVIYQAYPTPHEKSVAIQQLSLADYQSYLKHLFDRVGIDGLIYGNIKEDQAQVLVNQVEKVFKAAPYPKEEQWKKEVILLQDPYIVESQSEADGNAIILAIEDVNFTFKRRAAQQILMKGIHSPFFATLRTKQQTGYIVASYGEEIERKMLDIFVVQSNSHDPRDLLARFELFLENFLRELTSAEIPQERFEHLRSALLVTLEQSPKNLVEMGKLLFQLAFDFDGDFDWMDRRIKGMKDLTYEEFIAMVREVLHKQNRRRLAILMCGHTSEDYVLRYQKASDPTTFRQTSQYSSRK